MRTFAERSVFVGRSVKLSDHRYRYFVIFVGARSFHSTSELCTYGSYQINSRSFHRVARYLHTQRRTPKIKKEDKALQRRIKKDASLTLNSPFGVCSSSSNQTKLVVNQTKLANCKLRNKTVPGKSRENQLLQRS